MEFIINKLITMKTKNKLKNNLQNITTKVYSTQKWKEKYYQDHKLQQELVQVLTT